IAEPKDVVDALGQLPQSFLALSQRRLGRLPGRDVPLKPPVALLELERLAFQLADERLAVLPKDPRLVRCLRRPFHGPRPRSHRPNLLEQRGRFGGLQDEGIGAELSRQLFVVGVGVGRRVDHERHGLQALVEPPPPQQRVAVHHGHQQIGDDQLRRLLPGSDQGLRTVTCGAHLVAVSAEQHPQVVGLLIPVVDDQYLHDRGPLAPFAPARPRVRQGYGHPPRNTPHPGRRARAYGADGSWYLSLLILATSEIQTTTLSRRTTMTKVFGTEFRRVDRRE